MRGKRAASSASGLGKPALTAAERRDLERWQAYRRKRRMLRFGQLLMALGVVVAIVHWLAHIGAFGGQPSSLVDVLAGYPAGALLFILGAILAGQ